MTARRILVGIGLLISLGCVPNSDIALPPATPAPATPAPAATPTPAAPVAAAAPANAPAAAPQESAATPINAAGTPAQPPATTPAEAAPGTERVEAKAGVGKQGQSLKNDTGYVVEIAKAFFNFKQKIVFDDQIPKTMQLFEATEGRKPKSQEEFDEKIIKAGQIKLPVLPANHRYVYDPEKGELMVEKPAK